METQRIDSYQYHEYYAASMEPTDAELARRAAEEEATEARAVELQAEQIAMYAEYDGLGRYVNLLH
jgi:hypothetical protein